MLSKFGFWYVGKRFACLWLYLLQTFGFYIWIYHIWLSMYNMSLHAIFVMHKPIIVNLLFRLNMSLFVFIMIAEELKHVLTQLCIISILHIEINDITAQILWTWLFMIYYTYNETIYMSKYYKGTFYSTIGLLFWRRYIQVDKIYQMKIPRCYH
jgi:hypothetical protein